MREAENRREEKEKETVPKPTIVNQSTKDIIAIMQAHHVNNGLYKRT